MIANLIVARGSDGFFVCDGVLLVLVLVLVVLVLVVLVVVAVMVVRMVVDIAFSMTDALNVWMVWMLLCVCGVVCMFVSVTANVAVCMFVLCAQGYDISFLITNEHMEEMWKHKLVDFIIHFMEEIDKEISSMKYVCVPVCVVSVSEFVCVCVCACASLSLSPLTLCNHI